MKKKKKEYVKETNIYKDGLVTLSNYDQVKTSACDKTSFFSTCGYYVCFYHCQQKVSCQNFLQKCLIRRVIQNCVYLTLSDLIFYFLIQALLPGSYNLLDGQWHSVYVTFVDRSSTYSLFVDGRLLHSGYITRRYLECYEKLVSCLQRPT